MTSNANDPTRCLRPTEAEERAHLEHVIDRIAAELLAFSGRLNARLTESRDMAVAIQENKRDMDHAEKAVMRETVSTLTRINQHGSPAPFSPRGWSSIA